MADTEQRRITGVIRPIAGGNGFDFETWCRFISECTEFRRRPPKQFPNPFKRGEMAVAPSPRDSAEVVLEDRSVGQVYWSMSEEPLINVIVEPSAMPLVEEWAAAMGGVFRTEPWDQ